MQVPAKLRSVGLPVGAFANQRHIRHRTSNQPPKCSPMSSGEGRDQDIQPGDHVAWNWGSSHAEGVVAEKATERLTKEIKGKSITRVGTEDNPAFFVEREEKGKNPVVKKASELQKLDSEEDIPSTQHVETERQKRQHDH